MAELAPVTIEGAPAPTPAPQPEARAMAIPTDDPGHVALVDDAGEVQSVPIGNAEQALGMGYRPATDVEYYRAKTGAAGTAMAAVTGFGRGLSMGAFDPLAVGAERLIHGDQGAEEMRQTLRLLKEGHETASMAGEFAGSLAPLALGVGAGAAGEAAVAGESALARAGTRALQAAPRAFLEGAAIEAGQQLSEDTLGNHDLVAQKYVASALEGGVLGALLGAGLHAGVGAIGDKLATRGAAAAEKAAESGVYRTSARGAETAEKAAETGGYRTFGSKLADLAEEQAAKGAMPASSLSAAEMQKLGRTAEEQQARVRRIGRTLLDEGITTPGATKAVQAERLTKRVAEAGEELGAIRSGLEKAAVRPSVENIEQRIANEVLKPLVARPFSQAEQASVKPFVQELAERFQGKTTFESFDELHKLRVALDKKLDPKLWSKIPGTAPAGYQELGQIRGILESEYERAAAEAAKELGNGLDQKYQVAKALFSDLKTAEKWATKGAAREAQNRAISLTDTIMAGAGIASGNPLGVLAPVGNKMVRTYGNQVAAVIADKASKLFGVQRAAEAFDARLTKAVDGFYKGGKKGAKVPSGASPNVDPETARALRAATKNPAALTEHVSKVVQNTGLGTDAPKVAQGVTSVLMRAGSYLQTRLPGEPPPAGFTFGPSKPRALGPHAQAKMNAVVGALDTEGMLADIERGRIDRQKVEALKFINPDLHNEIIQALVRHGQANAAELTHQQEAALSILTGQPIGAMMQPRTIRGFQQAHTAGAPPDPAQAGVTRQPIGNATERGSSRLSNTYRSGSDRMEASNE